MRRIIVIVLISVLNISSIPFSFRTKSIRPPLPAVMTYPDNNYSIGDIVTINVHVFRLDSK
jgi:hypothetical protein